MHKKEKINLVNREILHRKHIKDESRKGFNFVGSEYKWTDIDEQKMRVTEIEKNTKSK